jgi:MFS family permease
MLRGPSSDYNFQLHWASVALSQFGAAFTSIALPWLVLSLTGDDPVSMTTVQAAMSLPTGVFLLCGGALADRFSPLKALFVSRVAFIVTMAVLTALTWLSLTPLWSLYAFAVALGTLIALGVPASQSLLPALVKPEKLARANGLVIGTVHAAQLVGPMAAGWSIWLARRAHGVPDGVADSASIAIAFGVDAAAVCLALVLMCFMNVAVAPAPGLSVLSFVREGLLFCWRERGMRLVIGYLALVSFFLQGPLLAGLPLLTKLNLGMYERTFGSLYAILGLGTIAGAGLAMWMRPTAARLGAVVLCCDLAVGGAFSLLGQVHRVWPAYSLLFVMGSGLGLTMVAGTTWFQAQTPGRFMGRVMSLVLFALFGLTPISSSLTGYFVERYSLSWVTGVSGAMILGLAGLGLLIPRVRQMGVLTRGAAAPLTPQQTQ